MGRIKEDIGWSILTFRWLKSITLFMYTIIFLLYIIAQEWNFKSFFDVGNITRKYTASHIGVPNVSLR